MIGKEDSNYPGKEERRLKNENRIELAVYGKGGIGKSTVSANLSAALACQGHRVLQIGCDPKHDSTRLLTGGVSIETVLDYRRDEGDNATDLSRVLIEGRYGIGCVEAGGPRPGVGCAGRGIISSFEFLERFKAKNAYDTIVYDVLGDVVCGGFAVPVRREYADAIFLVTSGEYMALYAANNILRGIFSYDGTSERRVAGIIYNERRLPDEDARVQRFAQAVGLPVLVKIPRSDAFASAERNHMPILDLEGYEAEKTAFRRLASSITRDMSLYPACPLSDEALETVVLQTGCSPDASTKAEKPTFPLPRPTTEVSSCDNAPAVHSAVPDSAKKDHFSATQTAASSLQHRRTLYGCAFNGAATCGIHLTDALIVAHSPRACAFYTWQNISSPGRKNLFNRGILMPSAISPHYLCSEMGQTEAVFGGTETLKRTVARAMEQEPAAVLVISSCVSGIIGDDLQAAESLSTPQTPVIVIPADGDIAGDYMEGIRMCMHAVGSRLIDRSVVPSGRRVNFINEAGVSVNHLSNYLAMQDLLSGLGITVNCRFLGDATVDEVRSLLAAPLNIRANDGEDTRELQHWLEREYGCRFASGAFPVGIHSTCRFLQELGEFFDCSELVPALIEAEEIKYNREIEQLKPVLKGRRLVITTINANIDYLLRTADDLEMDIVKIGVINYLHTDLCISERPDRYPIDESFGWEGLYDNLSDLKPDFVISNYTPISEEGDYVRDMVPMMPAVGFRAGLDIAERWAKLIQERREGGWMNDRQYFENYFA